MNANRVLRSAFLTTIAAALIGAPAALAEPGDVYVLDRGAGGEASVLAVDPDSGAQRSITSGDMLDDPSGIAVAPDGMLYVTNPGTATVVGVDPASGEQRLVHRGAPLVSPQGIAAGGSKRKPTLRVIDPGADPQPLAGFGTGNVFTGSPDGGFRPYKLGSVEGPFSEMTATDSGSVLDRSAGEGGGPVIYFVGEICFEGDTSVSCENVQEIETEGGELIDPVGLGYLGANIGRLAVADTAAAAPGKLITVAGGEQEVLAQGDELADPNDVALLPARLGAPIRALITDPGAAAGSGALLSLDPSTGEQVVIASGGELANPAGIAVELEGCFGDPASKLTQIGTSSDDDIVVDSAERQEIHAYGGNDRIELVTGADRGFTHSACGGDGHDVMVGSPGYDSFVGGSGNDRMLGGDDEDFLIGSKGKDVAIGGAGYDDLYGGPGKDRLSGGEGGGTVNGGPGGDRLSGGRDRDRFEGGDGRDRIKAKDGTRTRDQVECGDGRDKAIVDPRDRVAKDCEKVVVRKR